MWPEREVMTLAEAADFLRFPALRSWIETETLSPIRVVSLVEGGKHWEAGSQQVAPSTGSQQVDVSVIDISHGRVYHRNSRYL